MRTIKQLPELSYLKECFDLSEEVHSGLVWRLRPPHHFASIRGCNVANKRVGKKPAGSISEDSNGKCYYSVRLNNSLYKTHRIVYSLAHNLELKSSDEIDHINGDGTDNRLENLRLATHSSNQQNTGEYKNNTSGVKNVTYNKKSSCYFGEVKHQGIRYSTRGSPSLEVVKEMVKTLRENLHKEFANHGK